MCGDYPDAAAAFLRATHNSCCSATACPPVDQTATAAGASVSAMIRKTVVDETSRR